MADIPVSKNAQKNIITFPKAIKVIEIARFIQPPTRVKFVFEGKK